MIIQFPWMIFILFSLSFAATSYVEDYKYRKCNDSPFCVRNREIGSQHWTIDPDSIKNQKNIFEVQINDTTHSNILNLYIEFLYCGFSRVRIQPATKENFNRFDASKEKSIIDSKELSEKIVFELKKENDKATLTTKNQVIIVFYNPFKVVINDPKGHKRLTLNPNDDAVFETNFKKEEYPEMFESSFDYQTDEIRNGPTSVAMTVNFETPFVKLSGLPSHTLSLNLAQTIHLSEPIRLFNTDGCRYDVNSNMAMHGSVPFIFAHPPPNKNNMCDGVFWLNPTETWVDIGPIQYSESKGSKARFLSEGGFIDIFLVSGSPKDVINTFTKLTGRPQLVPQFALGFHQSQGNYIIDDKIFNVTESLDNIQVPFESIWLGYDITKNRNYFEFDTNRLINPSRFLKNLANVKRYAIAYIAPHLGIKENPLFNEALTKVNLNNKDFFLLKYKGNSLPGKSAWIDFMNPKGREWWKSLFSYSKFKYSSENLFVSLDMNEPSVYEDDEMTLKRSLLHYGDIEHREIHNIYGHISSYLTYEALLNRNSNKNIRPFLLSRSFFAGTQKYALVSTAGSSGKWRSLAASISMVLQYGLAGQIYSGTDIGGFYDFPKSKLITRWYQIGAWVYPFFRANCHHSSGNHEIYSLKKEYINIAKDAVHHRYKLLPYWYTLARNANLTGEPIVRPIWWEFKNYEVEGKDTIYFKYLDSNDVNVMLGKCLLIAPFLVKNQTQKRVIFPKNSPKEKWYNYKTMHEITGNSTLVHDKDSRTAVFLRGGSIIPTKLVVRRSSELMQNDPYSLVIGLDENGKANGELYIDDGKTFDFLKSNYIHKTFSFSDNKLTSKHLSNKNSSNDFSKSYTAELQQLKIIGLNKPPKKIHSSSGSSFQFTVDKNNLVVVNKINIPIKDDFEIMFDF